MIVYKKHNSIKAALVGCGLAGKWLHAPHLAQLQRDGELEVTAIVDPDAKAREAVAAKLPAARQLASLDELPDVDLAVVTAPPRHHAPICTELLSRGAHILCEKPMALNVADAEAMVAAARAAGVILSVGHMRRHHPATRAIRRIVREGVYGPLRRVTLVEGGTFTWPIASDGMFRRGNGGGILVDIAVHDLDLLRWWFGELEPTAYEDDAMGGVEMSCRIALAFEGGATGEIRLTRECDVDDRCIIELERATLLWNPLESDCFEIRNPGFDFAEDTELAGLRLRQRVATAAGIGGDHAFLDQLRNMVRAIRDGGAPVTSAEDGLASVRLLESCQALRRPLAMPWLSAAEQRAAERLSC